MRRVAVPALLAALLLTTVPLAAQEGGTGAEIEAPAGSPAGAEPAQQGYRPPWADPYAEPPMPGIENDPTPFDPADVDSGPSPLSNGPD
jgi:hypothetical protein